MKKENKGHVISSVAPSSIGEELELMPGDIVVSINGQEIKDIFDYRFLCDDEELVLGVINKESGEFWEYEIEKDEDEDLGRSSLSLVIYIPRALLQILWLESACPEGRTPKRP